LLNKDIAERRAEKTRLEKAITKRTKELQQAYKELVFQNEEKEKRAAELIIANKELAFQNKEKEKRAADLIIANEELAIQNTEKENRAAELIIANEELAFQNKEKENRAAELITANKELIIQSDEKEKRADELSLANIQIQKNYEEHFSQMANLMPDKIFTANADGFTTFYNQNWLDFSGRTQEELTGFGWKSMMHPDEIADVEKCWTNSLFTGKAFEMEMQCLSKSDGYKWFLTHAVPIKNLNGIILSWIGTATEIQKGKEEQQRKDNFIKMVSHELKTPVTSIKGYVQMLLMIVGEKNVEQFHDQIKNSLVRVEHQVTRLTRLITEMLDLSRIEAGRLELQQELFSINVLVKETIDDIGLTNPKHTINLHSDFVCNVYGDRGRIEQVIINLVTNAIKYSATSINIEVRILKGEKKMVSVSVRDFGIGIDKADHKKIFERFFRVEGKVEQTFAGFGIGLFIANEIIMRHNGYITVESEKGVGSIFTFALPYSTETIA
jgi:PAS domain S-box-containing protein